MFHEWHILFFALLDYQTGVLKDRDDFIAMCLRQAQPERLQWLRANRGYWRQQVQRITFR